MERINRLFLWLIVIGPLHMTEQMLTSIEEFYMLRGKLDGYYALFDAANQGIASVLLITIVFTFISLMLYGALLGGRARLAVVGLFGLMGAGEIHHAIESIVEMNYDPGVITCFAYSAVGCLLLREVWQQLRFHRMGKMLVANA